MRTTRERARGLVDERESFRGKPLQDCIAALGDENPIRRRAAAASLFERGPAAKNVVPELIRLLDRPGGPQEVGALNALRKIGPDAAVAVPAIVRNYVALGGNAPYHADTLAAIGPAATEAVPHLEEYATDRNGRYLADAFYALFCIRGHASDVQNMVRLLARTDLRRPHQKSYVIGFLRRLGVKAQPAEDVIRILLTAGDLPENADRLALRGILRRLEAGD